MSGKYEETGTCRDVDGDLVKVGHMRALVIIETQSFAGGIHLGPAEREVFTRLYMDAERSAEAWAGANPGGDLDA